MKNIFNNHYSLSKNLNLYLLGFILTLFTIDVKAQLSFKPKNDLRDINIKLVSRSYGPILGANSGKYTFIQIGAEYHWRKISLFDPKIIAIGGDFQYNFGHNTLIYKANFWTKQHRIGLTYGGGLGLFTDFDHFRYGISPTVGFRLLIFHLQTGVNLAIGSKELKTYNKLFVGLNIFIPSENKLKFKK